MTPEQKIAALEDEINGLKGLLLAMMEVQRSLVGTAPPGYYLLRANLGFPTPSYTLRHFRDQDRRSVIPSGEGLAPF